MALTREIIEKNLSGLTDEQYNAIVTMSQNDEENYMRTRTREIYNEMDETISMALGIPRNGAEKTYTYLERAAKEFAGKYADYDAIKGQVSELTKANAALQKTIEEGVADKELSSKYEVAVKDLANARKAYGQLKADFDAQKAEHEKALISMRVDSALEAAAGSLKIRKDVNPQLAQFAVKSALDTVKGYAPAFEDDGKGGKVLVFYNEDGSRRNNPEKALAPFTASELIAEQLKSLGVLEEAAPGLGTGGRSPQGPAPTALGARTRVEADEAIEKELSVRGFVRGTDKWNDEFHRLRTEYKVSELPLK